MAPFKITIIGAGPAGSVLARSLLDTDAEVRVFEAEDSFDARGQGGILDLHEETGLLTLRECRLYSRFLKYTRFDGEAIKVCDKDLLHQLRWHDVKYLAEEAWVGIIIYIVD